MIQGESSGALYRQDNFLVVKDLKKYFPSATGVCKAVDGVSFSVQEGETIGLVGESGCGKTTLGLAVLRLLDATAGEVHYRDVDVLSLKKKELRAMRQKMQIIFQDPYDSLNPRLNILNIIGEPLEVYGVERGAKKKERVKELLEVVGLSGQHLYRYPHEFSGGQRQRICIARALALNPELIVCDEPVSALDVSIQSQILNLLADLQEELGLTYIFIAHDLSVVKHISKKVGVMYLGKMVELANKKTIFQDPKHPYTQALISAIPIPDPDQKVERIILEGDIPSPMNPPSGCKFHTRCKYVMPVCKVEEPDFINIGGQHYVACHLIKIN